MPTLVPQTEKTLGIFGAKITSQPKVVMRQVESHVSSNLDRFPVSKPGRSKYVSFD